MIGRAVALLAALVLYAGCGGGDEPAGGGSGWGALEPAKLARTEVAAARIADRIYVAGGFVSTGGTTERVERYDISEGRWSEVAELPIAVNHPAMVAFDGRLYLLGGNRPRSGGESKSDRLYRYSPKGDRWTRLPDAPSARAALALAEIDGSLYAVGGDTAANPKVTTLEIYDVDRRRWRTGPPMPTGRNHIAAAVVGDRLYVTGGRPGPVHGGLATVERYDADTRRWAAVAPMPTARSGHAAIASRGRLVVFGGEELDGGETIEQVEVYDPGTDSWAALADMVTPRHGLGGIARRGRVFAIEGGPRPGLTYSRALEFFDLAR